MSKPLDADLRARIQKARAEGLGRKALVERFGSAAKTVCSQELIPRKPVTQRATKSSAQVIRERKLAK